MQSTLKVTVLSLLTLAMTLVAPQALAMPNGHMGDQWGPRLHALIKYANLTPEQHAQVRAILEKAAPQRRSLRQQSGALREQMAAKMLGSGTLTSADFSALTQQEAQIHQQQVELVLSVSVQIRNLLSPTQVSHIAQIHQRMQELNAQRRAILHDAAENEDEEQQ